MRVIVRALALTPVTCVAALAVVLLTAAPAAAQAPIEECGTFRDSLVALVEHRDTDGSPLPADAVARQAARLSSVQNNAYCVALFVASQARPAALDFNALVKRFESARSDKQAGAGAGTGTSVVAEGPAAKVLSAAVEYGALTRGVDGQVVTLRGNLAGLPSALVQKNVFPYCPAGRATSEFCVEHSILSWLRRVSFAASFDGARGTQVSGTPAGAARASGDGAQPVTFTADRRQLAGGSARIELWNRRDVTSRAFQDQWRRMVGAAMSASATDLQATAGDFTDRLLAIPGYDQWQRETAQALAADGTAATPSRAQLIETLQTRLDMLVGMARAAGVDLDAPASRALGSYSRFFLAQDDLIDSLARQPVVALEYGFSRPQGAVETRTARLIADLPLTTRTRLVANGAWTMYQRLPLGLPAGTSKTRDYQAGLQLEHSLGAQSIVGPAVIVLALYHQAQRAPALFQIDPSAPLPGVSFTGLPDTAATVFTDTGDITLGQLKLVVSPPGSSVKIPLSVTYANRTELVAKPIWRAQVGLAYDLDALLGAVRR